MRRPHMPRPTWRHLWLVPGLAVAFYANARRGLHGLGLAPVPIFASSRIYWSCWDAGNLTHQGNSPVGQSRSSMSCIIHVLLALLAIAATGALSPFWLVGAIAWLSHIVVDWAMGDGLRSADGFHLDRLDFRRPALCFAGEGAPARWRARRDPTGARSACRPSGLAGLALASGRDVTDGAGSVGSSPLAPTKPVSPVRGPLRLGDRRLTARIVCRAPRVPRHRRHAALDRELVHRHRSLRSGSLRQGLVVPSCGR